MSKINFTYNQIKEIEFEYITNGLSCEAIGKKYDVSKTPIKNILKEKNILKKGKSDGRKKILTQNQEETIKNLYLEGSKSMWEIADEVGLKKSYLDKYLSDCEYRRNLGESISLRQKGKKRSQEVRQILKAAQQKLAESGNRKQHGGVCKTYDVMGTKCQGTFEKFYIEKIIHEKKDIPTQPKQIKTPFGVYTADFFDGENLIEIKSDYTYEVLIGIKKNRWTDKYDLTQYEKIKWVHHNVNPIDIIVVDKKNNKLIKKQIL